MQVNPSQVYAPVVPQGLRSFHQSSQFHFVTFSCSRRQPKRPLLISPQALSV